MRFVVIYNGDVWIDNWNGGKCVSTKPGQEVESFFGLDELIVTLLKPNNAIKISRSYRRFLEEEKAIRRLR